MKKYNFIYWSMVGLLSSCSYGEIEGYQAGFASGGEVQALIMTPSSKTLYVDSEFPVLKYYSVPANALDTAVTWKSDMPEVLKVDAQTGELSWGTPRNVVVTITATNKTSGVEGHCFLTVKNMVGTYRYIDIRKQVGLWILDRNVGASVSGIDNPTDRRARGNFYQYDRNAVVSNWEFGGKDGKGGVWKFVIDGKEWELTGGFPEYIIGWNAEGPEYTDWTNPENTPCPKGWRLPTKEELEKIMYYATEDNFSTAREKGAAKLFYRQLGFGATGYCRVPDNFFEQGNSFWWSSTYDSASKEAWCLYVKDQQSPLMMKKAIKGIGMPVRCVKDGNSM